MKVSCLDCQKTYTVDANNLPPERETARCRVCGGIVPLNVRLAKATDIAHDDKTPAYRAGYIAGYDDVIEGRDGEPGSSPPTRCPHTTGSVDALEWLNGYSEGLDSGEEMLEREKQGLV